MKEFVAASTDEELRQFVRVMELGSEAERRAGSRLRGRRCSVS
jgi:hypothetical protein